MKYSELQEKYYENLERLRITIKERNKYEEDYFSLLESCNKVDVANTELHLRNKELFDENARLRR